MINQLKTITLLGGLSALLVGVGAVFGPTWLVGAVVLAVVLNFGSYFFSDKIVLAASGAREVGPNEAPWLHAMVAELADRAGIPKPKVCIIPGDHANAFATGRNPANGVVAFTEGILRLLSERELRGVAAHEIAHIQNRDILVATVAAALAAAVGYIANMLSFSALFGGHAADDDEEASPAGGLLFALVAPLVATVVQLSISRSREYLADETGARIAGDAEGLAGALERLHHAAEVVPGGEPATASLYIVNPMLGGIGSLFSTHPAPEERIRRLRSLRLPGRLFRQLSQLTYTA